MLFVPPSSYGTFVTTSGAPSVNFGILTTPNNTTNAYGASSFLVTRSAADSYGMTININSNAAAATNRNTVMQILIDPTGSGTTSSATIPLISGLLSSAASTYNQFGGGLWYRFPVFIPSGSGIAVRSRGTANVGHRINVIFDQKPRDPMFVETCRYVDTYGLTLGAGTAAGVSVTAAVSNKGNWTFIASSSRACRYWEFGLQVQSADTNWNVNAIHVDIGVGDGTVAGTREIISNGFLQSDGSENLNKRLIANGVYEVPSGSAIYGRISVSGATDPFQLVAYCCGG